MSKNKIETNDEKQTSESQKKPWQIDTSTPRSGMEDTTKSSFTDSPSQRASKKTRYEEWKSTAYKASGKPYSDKELQKENMKFVKSILIDPRWIDILNKQSHNSGTRYFLKESD